MIYELERIWKEVVVVHSRYCPGICPEEMRKTTGSLSEDGGCPSQDSNGAPPEHKSRALEQDQLVLFLEVMY
jgi:hypothetical protein